MLATRDGRQPCLTLANAGVGTQWYVLDELSDLKVCRPTELFITQDCLRKTSDITQ